MRERVAQGTVTETLASHSLDEIAVFLAVLASDLAGETPARTAMVYDEYESVCDQLGIRSKVERRMRNRLKALDTSGSIDLMKTTGGRAGGPRFEAAPAVPVEASLDVLEFDEQFAA